MKNYGQVLELDEITLNDCLNLYAKNKNMTIIINDGKVIDILDEDK